jgi:hypothetical protein
MEDFNRVLEDLLSDFPSNHPLYTEKIKSGVHALAYQYPDKAMVHFDAAHSLDPAHPACSIGQLFASLHLATALDCHLLDIQGFLAGFQKMEATLRHKYLGTFLTALCHKQSIALRTHVESVFLREKRQQMALTEQASADLLGLYKTGAYTQLPIYALLAPVAGTTTIEALESAQLAIIQRSKYAGALLQVHLSRPLVRGILELHLPISTEQLQDLSKIGLHTWQYNVLFLLDALKEQLLEALRKGARDKGLLNKDLGSQECAELEYVLGYLGMRESAMSKVLMDLEAFLNLLTSDNKVGLGAFLLGRKNQKELKAWVEKIAVIYFSREEVLRQDF